MNFHSHDDKTGNDEVMCSMKLFEFYNRFCLSKTIMGLKSWIDNHTIEGVGDHLTLLQPDFYNWLLTDAGKYLIHRIDQAMYISINLHNAREREYQRAHKHWPNRFINYDSPMIVWHMSKVDATHMKLKFG